MADTLLSHQPVLLAETLDALAIRSDGCYVDATFGRGGHSAAILERLGDNGLLLALDRDPAAGDGVSAHLQQDARFHFSRTAFSKLGKVVAARGLEGHIHGILLDLGVSSPQLDDPMRGFGFSRDGILDMRMDPASGVSAAEWIHRISEADLSRVLAELGEERFHRRVARAIVAARQQEAITTTGRLAAIVAAAIPTRESGKHPATRAFQAIRIAVNNELGELQTVLPQAVQVLAAGGRLVVMSFHSLEDRIVKRFMREQARGREWPLNLPVTGRPEGMTLRVVNRVLRPSAAEIATNPRARSALLRVAERL